MSQRPTWSQACADADATPMADPVKKVHPPSPNEVVPGLFISNMATAAAYIQGTLPNSSSLYEPRITHVLSIYTDKPRYKQRLHPPPECELKCHQILADDAYDTNLIDYFPEICSFIHTALQESGAKVLVHCYAGMSRSATAVICYLIWAYNMTFADAFQLAHSKRQIVNPNAGFQAQLQLWQGVKCNLMGEDGFQKFELTVFMLEREWRCLKGAPPDRLALRKIPRPKETIIDIRTADVARPHAGGIEKVIESRATES